MTYNCNFVVFKQTCFAQGSITSKVNEDKEDKQSSKKGSRKVDMYDRISQPPYVGEPNQSHYSGNEADNRDPTASNTDDIKNCFVGLWDKTVVSCHQYTEASKMGCLAHHILISFLCLCHARC